MGQTVTSFLLAAALALPVAAVPGAARADEVVGVLSVAEPPGPDAALAAATEQLRSALAASMPGVLGAAELRARMVGKPPPSTLAELERARAGAVAAYAAGEFEASLRTLRAVVDALEALPPGPAPFEEWVATMLRLARTEQELGHRAEAAAALERLLRAAPDTRPDARRYPPSFLALVEESRERLRALGTRRLAVDAGAGARVFVEGREVGTSPVTVALPPGRYRVAGERGEVRAVAVVADLSEQDGTVQLDLATSEAQRPDAGPGLALPAQDRPLRLATAAGRLGLDRVVTASLLREGEVAYLVATVHDLGLGRAEREGRVRLQAGAPPAGALDALAAFLATGRASALVSTPAGPTLALEAVPRPGAALAGALAPPPAPPPPCSGAYGWAAVASGVASVFLGLAAYDNGRIAADEYSQARAMLDDQGRPRPGYTVSDYNAKIGYGDEDRMKAIGFGAGAAVGLAATTALAIVNHRRCAGAPAIAEGTPLAYARETR